MEKGIQNFSSLYSARSFLILKLSLCHYKIMRTIFDIDSRCQEIFVIFDVKESSFTVINLNSFWTSPNRRSFLSFLLLSERKKKIIMFCANWKLKELSYRIKELFVDIKQLIKDIWVSWRCSFWKFLDTVFPLIIDRAQISVTL